MEADSSWRESLDERLANAGLFQGWLDAAVDGYDGHWRDWKDWPDAEPLGETHAELASWILATLRLKEPSTEFSAELQERVLRRYRSEVDANAAMPSPSSRVRVVGWTLGKVVGEYDRDLPVAPAVRPRDPDVAAAYDGLVEHVVHLGSQTMNPWPEMLGTSTYWRGAGIAEALQPDEASLANAIARSVKASRPLLNESEYDLVRRHWQANDFDKKRNAVTHVKASSGMSFTAVSTTAGDKLAIRPTLVGITQFVCQQVSLELANQEVRPELSTIWDNELWWEIGGT
jgi:hypothetical protein